MPPRAAFHCFHSYLKDSIPEGGIFALRYYSLLRDSIPLKAGCRHYSYRNASTGFAVAALTAPKLTVTAAATRAIAAASRNAHRLRFIL